VNAAILHLRTDEVDVRTFCLSNGISSIKTHGNIESSRKVCWHGGRTAERDCPAGSATT